MVTFAAVCRNATHVGYAVLALLIACAEPAAAVNTVSTSKASFANNPEISSAGLRKTASGWFLTFDATFANDCFAEKGLTAAFVDRGVPGRPARRFVLAKQNPAPEGCPEIYMPVTEKIAADLGSVTGINEVTLLDYFQPDKSANGIFHVRTFAVDASAEGSDLESERKRVSLEPLFPNAALGEIRNLKVAGNFSDDRRSYVYSVDFEYSYAGPCQAETATEIEVIEGRVGVTENEKAPVVDWLFVVTRDSEPCSASTTTETATRFGFSREIRIDYPRILAVVNPMPDSEEALPTFDIWPPAPGK